MTTVHAAAMGLGRTARRRIHNIHPIVTVCLPACLLFINICREYTHFKFDSIEMCRNHTEDIPTCTVRCTVCTSCSMLVCICIVCTSIHIKLIVLFKSSFWPILSSSFFSHYFDSKLYNDIIICCRLVWTVDCFKLCDDDIGAHVENGYRMSHTRHAYASWTHEQWTVNAEHKNDKMKQKKKMKILMNDNITAK